MKSFIVSICFFLVFAFLVTINCIRVTDFLGNILDSLCELPESEGNSIPDIARQKTDSICTYWAKNRDFLSLSVNNSELRDCQNALYDLAGYSASDTGADYDASLSKARTVISDLAERESVSFFNIF